MAAVLLRAFARKVAKSVPQTSVKPPPVAAPPPKNKDKNTEFPAELRRAGVSKKSLDPNFLQYVSDRQFIDLKKKGMPEHMDRIMSDRIEKGESPEEIIDSFLSGAIKEDKKGKVDPRKEEKRREEAKITTSPIDLKPDIPPEVQEQLSQYIKQFEVSSKILETSKKEKDISFRERGKADLVQAFEEEGKYAGGIHGGGEKGDKYVKREVEDNMQTTDLEALTDPDGVANPTEYQQYLLSLEPDEQKHIRRRLEEEEARAQKAKKHQYSPLREKIKQKRAIRDKYKSFNISLHRDEYEEDDKLDPVVVSTQKNVMKVLSEIVNRRKNGVVQEVMDGAFVSISRVQVNKALSVMNVFYNVHRPDLDFKVGLTPEKTALRESVHRRLVHAKGFIASQLVGKIGLKFAPDLRFIQYVLGAPPRQVVVSATKDKKAIEESEKNSELYVRLAEIEDEKHFTPRLPSKYTVRRVRDLQKRADDK